jgi:hypothetical protein
MLSNYQSHRLNLPSGLRHSLKKVTRVNTSFTHGLRPSGLAGAILGFHFVEKKAIDGKEAFPRSLKRNSG